MVQIVKIGQQKPKISTKYNWCIYFQFTM